jgi:hypothetical protein
MIAVNKAILFGLAISLIGARAGFCADQSATRQVKLPEAGERSDTPAKARSDEGLNAVLREWARARQNPDEWHQNFTWTVRDPLCNQEKLDKVIDHGEIWIRRPDHLRVEARDSKGNPLLTVLCVGENAQIYFFLERTAFIFSLPAGCRLPASAEQRAARDPGFFDAIGETLAWSVFGPPVSALNGRFVIRLEKEDDFWSYIRLDPIRTHWWMPYSEWQVVLDRKDRWIRRVWQHNVGGDCEITVEFKRPERRQFQPDIWDPPFKELPEGWKKK